MPSATRKGREGRGEAPRDCEVHVKWNICLICMMQTPKKKHYGPNNILFCYVYVYTNHIYGTRDMIF